MKKVISLLFVGFLSTNAFCAGLEYFQAVINASSLKELEAIGYAQDVQSIVHDKTNTYRCLGCYDFKVTLVNPAGEDETHVFQTELLGSEIVVRRM